MSAEDADGVGGKEEEPQVFRIGEIPGTEPATRREFIKSTLMTVGAVALISHVVGCEESELDIQTQNGRCTCHVVDAKNNDCTCQTVCTCHSVSTCVCNTVCTCNTVAGAVEGQTTNCPSNCSCHGHCSCHGQGGGHYWYPC